MTTMKSSIKEIQKMPDRTNSVGMAIASSVSFEEAFDLDLTDSMVERLNTGASIQQLQSEIDAGIANRQKKLNELKARMTEQLEIALRITLADDEEANKNALGDTKF